VCCVEKLKRRDNPMQEGTITRPSRNLLEGFRAIPTATISDVLDSLKISGIVNGFRCLIPSVRIAGCAFTVKSIAGERDTYTAADFPIGQVIAKMEEGDVFVVDLGGREVSHAGGLACTAMKARGVAGMVIDGGCRDIDHVLNIGFPAYSRHVCATGARSRVKIDAINVPIEVAGIRVCPGDIVVADATSVAVVPSAVAQKVLEECQSREELEGQFVANLNKGGTFEESHKKLGIL
jgi:regulator of RNase E activity RraA